MDHQQSLKDEGQHGNIRVFYSRSLIAKQAHLSFAQAYEPLLVLVGQPG